MRLADRLAAVLICMLAIVPKVEFRPMCALPKSKLVGGYAERRRRVQAAEALLSEVATDTAYRPNYARMNPKLRLKSNVFWLGDLGRAVIRGPWVYVHAGGVRIPSGMERVKTVRSLVQSRCASSSNSGRRA